MVPDYQKAEVLISLKPEVIISVGQFYAEKKHFYFNLGVNDLVQWDDTIISYATNKVQAPLRP